MNRSQRRAEEQRARASGALSPDLRERFREARIHHQAGRLDQAADLYHHILQAQPDHAEAAQLLGLIAYRYGRLEEACRLLQQAIAADATQPTYHFNLGVITQKRGDHDAAESSYRRAIELNPRYAEAWSNLGNLLRDRGRPAEAVVHYRQAITLTPMSPDLHNNLGVALKELGETTNAQQAYDCALGLKPDHVEARNNLGLLHMESGHFDRARACFEQAIQVDSSNWKSHYYLGLLSVWQQRQDEAVAHLTTTARLKHDHGRRIRPHLVSRARLKHDVEQISYLIEKDRLGPEAQDYVEALRRIRSAADAISPPQTWVQLDPADADALAPCWNRILYPAQARHIATGALNPRLDVEAIEGQWLAKQPEILFVDELLTPEALAAMRAFCWEATIWKKEYENGYLGAFIGDGFATPLLFQIAEELRTRFPRIFKDHRLTQSWSFKHDSARRGLGMHADAAAVNVNFWVTPDEANLDPASGGLLVWDKEAPQDWNFKEYNSEKNRGKIQAFLEQSGAQMVRVPYRYNRAVIFNSDLFHETDDVKFRDDYLSRRINITLLYGFRSKA